MQKLHLVGFTTDQNGLILSARRGARSGSYTLVLDDALAQAVDDMRERKAEEAEAAGIGRSDRTESRLPIGEIQARLRRGRSLKDVAKDAGVDQEWVERFAAPVFAEQAQVISRVQGIYYKRARLGPSGLRVGDAVRRNLAERGVVMSPAEFGDAWRTHQRPDGRWIVTFTFHYRGAAKTLKFEVRPSGDIVATDQLTAQIAYITPPKKPKPRPRPTPVLADDATAKRAVVTTGFRPDPPVKAVSRPGKEREKAAAAMNKAAARRAIEGERAAARKARERDQMLARREREAAAEAVRRSREIAAKAREAAASARLVAAEQAEREKGTAAVAAARQAEREAARRKARLKVKAASKTVAAKKAAAERFDRAGKDAAARAASTRSTRPTTRSDGAGAPPAARPRPSAAARVEAPPPARRSAVTPAPKHAAPSSRRAAAPPARTARSAAGDRRPTADPPTPVPAPAARPTVRKPAAEPARAQFRAGLATPASGRDQPTQATPAVRTPPGRDAPANGAAPSRPPGVRRTRPLRAT